MSKEIKEEEEKYSKFLEHLNRAVEGREDEFKKAAMEDSQRIMNEYTQALTLSSLKKFITEWEADTPEEIEALELIKVRTKRRMKMYATCGFVASGLFSGKG